MGLCMGGGFATLDNSEVLTPVDYLYFIKFQFASPPTLQCCTHKTITVMRTGTFGLWSICCDSVEDVDEDEEKSDEKCHSARDDIRRHNKANPRHNNKQT